eukprot:6259862-Amphidinium_carterae.1
MAHYRRFAVAAPEGRTPCTNSDYMVNPAQPRPSLEPIGAHEFGKKTIVFWYSHPGPMCKGGMFRSLQQSLVPFAHNLLHGLRKEQNDKNPKIENATNALRVMPIWHSIPSDCKVMESEALHQVPQLYGFSYGMGRKTLAWIRFTMTKLHFTCVVATEITAGVQDEPT